MCVCISIYIYTGLGQLRCVLCICECVCEGWVALVNCQVYSFHPGPTSPHHVYPLHPPRILYSHSTLLPRALESWSLTLQTDEPEKPEETGATNVTPCPAGWDPLPGSS